VAPTADGANGDLQRPELSRLWDRVADRLHRNGQAPLGTIVLDRLRPDERASLTDLLDRPVSGDRVRVDLAQLDARLRAVHRDGLVATVARLRGPFGDRRVLPPSATDRLDPGAAGPPGQSNVAQSGPRILAAGEAPATAPPPGSAGWRGGGAGPLRRNRAGIRSRLSVLDAARQAIEQGELADEAWARRWLEGLRRSPALPDLPPERQSALLVGAVGCLAELWSHQRANALVPLRVDDLAERTGGGPRALDDGAPLGALVLDGWAFALGRPAPATSAERMALWRAAGVMRSEIADVVLTFGLRPLDDGAAAAALRARSAAGYETHLSLRDIRRIDWTLADRSAVFVCDDPCVVEAAMDAGRRRPVVCLGGELGAVASALLDGLDQAGAYLRVRASFDWRGVATTNRLLARYACLPWRMGAFDYMQALASVGDGTGELEALTGTPVTASWDATLTEMMADSGRVVGERVLLEGLVSDLG